MAHAMVRGITLAFILAIGSFVDAQTVGSRALEDSVTAGADQPASAAPAAEDAGPPIDDTPPTTPPQSLFEWLIGPLSQEK